MLELNFDVSTQKSPFIFYILDSKFEMHILPDLNSNIKYVFQTYLYTI